MIASLHPLAQAWLERLDALSAALPPGPAAELRADLREHLAVALPPDADADAVRAVLRELGEPEDVLREAALAGDAAGGVPGAAAQPEPAPAPRATAPAASEFGAEQPARVRLGWRDVAALILVATAPVTASMPVVGLLAWAATMVVLLRSSTWTPSAKVLVSLLVMVTGVLSVLSMLPVMSGGSFSLNPPEVVRVMLVPILPGLAVYTFAAWALWRWGRRAGA